MMGVPMIVRRLNGLFLRAPIAENQEIKTRRHSSCYCPAWHTAANEQAQAAPRRKTKAGIQADKLARRQIRLVKQITWEEFGKAVRGSAIFALRGLAEQALAGSLLEDFR
jgi:hypothetical protein